MADVSLRQALIRQYRCGMLQLEGLPSSPTRFIVMAIIMGYRPWLGRPIASISPQRVMTIPCRCVRPYKSFFISYCSSDDRFPFAFPGSSLPNVAHHHTPIETLDKFA